MQYSQIAFILPLLFSLHFAPVKAGEWHCWQSGVTEGEASPESRMACRASAIQEFYKSYPDSKPDHANHELATSKAPSLTIENLFSSLYSWVIDGLL